MRITEQLRKRRNSLQTRYLLIILVALLLIPIVFPVSIFVAGLFSKLASLEDKPANGGLYTSISELEKMWHAEALELQGAAAAEINQRLREVSGKYNRASMFWVDGSGTTRLSLSAVQGGAYETDHQAKVIPAHWTAAGAISYMKESINRDPLTIVAFIGDRAEAGEGFMVMEIPRNVLNLGPNTNLGMWYGLVLLILFIGFAVVSWLFFKDIRKRLMRLQTAMNVTDTNGIPESIERGKPDEIGRLEEAFNNMVQELADSRRREAEEETLRKRLVSDLSHDLRTPLTVIRSHVHIITKEDLTAQGKESLKLMDERISDLSVLIENLLSYNLLNSGRITLNLQQKDVLRLLRESAAAWYPVWEKEGFEIDVELEAEPLYWMVDEIWFRRILDNLYQNIVRHARSGLYVGISTELRGELRVIVITDHGGGLHGHSESKGAGLGLSIVDMLIKRMKLEWAAESTENGTSVILYHPARKI